MSRVCRWVGAAASALGLACGGPAEGPGVPENLVLVTVSSLRSDHLGISGYQRNSTPALDLFAAAGAVLPEAVTPSPETGRAAAAALTGMDPTRITYGDPARLLAGAGLAELLSAAGYRTRAAVTHPAVAAALGFSAGFDEYRELWEEPGPAASAAAVEFAEAALQGAAPGEPPAEGEAAVAPLFLWIHLSTPEPPLAERAEDAPWDDGLTPEGPRFLPGPVPASAVVPESAADYGEVVDRYDAAVRSVDLAMDRILRAVRGGPGAGATLVVVTGLHGESLGEHGPVFERPRGLFRETLRVPILLGWPGAEGEKAPSEVRFPGVVSLADVMPTALELVGAAAAAPDPPPPGAFGKSLVPALRGEEPRPHRRVYSQTRTGLFSIFDGRLRMLRVPVPGQEEPLFALFNTVRDPNEAENRYADARMSTEPLRAELETRRIQTVAWQQESDRAAAGSNPLPDALIAALRARGYEVPAGGDP